MHNHAAGSMAVCSVCQSADLSKTQKLYRTAGERRCKSCIGAAAATPEGPEALQRGVGMVKKFKTEVNRDEAVAWAKAESSGIDTTRR